ncbi:MAG TPA: Flp pilus assembly protein CpaB [Gemmataceae bacterium]|nr:Flp pilus assembly protein CpaB [Gemmataceae bacterium]
MKQKNLIMLGVAVGCGLIAAIAVAKLSAGGNRGPETVKLLVAKKDIPIDTMIDDKNKDVLLGLTDVPKHLVPLDPVDSIESIKGKANSRTLKAGNAITISDFGNVKKIQIPDGLKQVAFQVTSTDGVDGFAKPGSKVDVHYIETTQTHKKRTAIILRDILVLAVGRVAENNDKHATAIEQVQSVSLGVTDAQASMISLAEKKGTLKLVLRSVPLTEAEKAEEGKITWIDDPFAPRDPPVVAPAPVEPPKLETAVMVKEPVPANTLINLDTVKKYFTSVEVKKTPDGVAASTTELLGKFVVKPLDRGTYVFKSVTADQAVEIAGPKKEPVAAAPPKADPKPEPEPEPKPEKVTYPRSYQTIVQGGRFVTIVWLEIAPGQYKSFESDEAADKYNPADDKKDEKKDDKKPSGRNPVGN